MEQAPRFYTITFDGETIGKTLTMPDALVFLHRYQSQSWQWAFTVGYDIITPDGVSLAAQERGEQ